MNIVSPGLGILTYTSTQHFNAGKRAFHAGLLYFGASGAALAVGRRCDSKINLGQCIGCPIWAAPETHFRMS